MDPTAPNGDQRPALETPKREGNAAMDSMMSKMGHCGNLPKFTISVKQGRVPQAKGAEASGLQGTTLLPALHSA